MLKPRNCIVFLLCLFALSAQSITSSYYSSLDGKSGSTLRSAITSLVYTKHTTALGYNWTFDGIDIVNNQVLDMYSTCSWTVTTDQCGNYSGVCGCYNREHTVPQSLFNEKSPQVGDRHHLFLTDGKVNGVRGDYAFGETNNTSTWSSVTNGSKALGQLGSASYAYSSSVTVFEPDDQYKGDIARAILYMVVRYATTNECRPYNGSTNSYPVTAWSSNAMFSGSLSTNYGLSDAAVQTFLKWHREDPVSAKEIARNTGVESKQGNRNPFIDYPCLVEYLWGNKKDQTFNLSSVKGTFESDFSVGNCDGCSTSCSGGSSTTTYTVTWKNNGSTYTTGNPTTSVTSGSQVTTLPTAPSAPSACSDKVFVGWSTTNIGTTATNTKPSVLFTTASASPAITANTTFYAVFATSSGGASGSASFSASNFSGQGTSGTGGSVSATSSGVTVACNKGYGDGSTLRCYSGSTLTISSSSTITAITFTFSGTSYTGGMSTSYSGLSTTNWTQSLASQARITAITVTYSSATYSAYVTQCSGSASCTSVPVLGPASTGNVTTTGATFTCANGITSLGSTGCSVTAYGFVYNTTGTPTLNNGTAVLVGESYTSTSTAFSTNMSGLNSSTTYYVRPYATNGYGTGYGSQASFTTKTPTSYTVTWKNNGSTYTTGNPTTSVTEGGQVTTLPTSPSAPTACSDYTFVGWSTDDIGTTPDNTAPTDLFTTASASPVINTNTTFYAVFSKTNGTLTTTTDNITLSTTGVTSGSTTYSNWSGKTVSSSAVYAGNSAGGNASIQLRTNSSNSGIVTTGSGGTAKTVTLTWNNATAAGRTIDVYGKTSAYSAASDLYSTSSQGTKIGSLVYGTSTTLDITGNYTYIGLRSNSGAQYLSNVAITWQSGSGSTEYITRCAAAVTYTITWNASSNGGSCSTATSTVTAGNAIGTLPTATKTGNTFDGWFTQASGGTQITESTVPTASTTYYAHFTPITYTVSYNKGTYGVGTNTSDTKTYGVALTLRDAIFTREGYTQTGWASNAAGTTYTYALNGNYTANAGTTLYPYWTALPTYTVTFKNGTTTYDTQTGYEGKSISVSAPTACDGFTFVGWSTQQYGSTYTGTPTIDYTGTIPSGNTTYYAVYSYQGNATTSLTNNYARITSLSDLTDGNYVVATSSNYAITNTVTDTYYLSRTSVTVSSNTISSPAASIIWQIAVSGSTITLYNAAVGKYIYSSTTTLGLNSATSANTSFTASLSGSAWTLTSAVNTSYKIRYYNNRFNSSTTATTLYLYKQQSETTYTTYYTTSTQLTVTVESDDTSMGTVSVQAL